MFILFHKRVCGPLANSLFDHRPDEALKPASKVETAYYKADHAIQQVLDLLSAARILRDELSDLAMLETQNLSCRRGTQKGRTSGGRRLPAGTLTAKS